MAAQPLHNNSRITGAGTGKEGCTKQSQEPKWPPNLYKAMPQWPLSLYTAMAGGQKP